MGTTIISGGDTPPVFEPPEHVFDLMTLFIQCFVEAGGEVAPLSWRDTRRYPLGEQSLSEFIAVISLVTKHVGRAFRQCRVDQLGSKMIAHRAFGEAQDDRSSQLIHYRVQLGVQSALGAANTSWNIPFLSRLAAVRWALR